MSRRTSFLGLGNEYCASAVGEDPGSEVQAERRSIYTLAYLQLPGDPTSLPGDRRICCSAGNGLCGATGPRDPDDVDLQAGAEMAVNTEAASPPPGL